MDTMDIRERAYRGKKRVLKVGATQWRRGRGRRGLGFKGKVGVGGARECDGQLLTALCRGELDVGELLS